MENQLTQLAIKEKKNKEQKEKSFFSSKYTFCDFNKPKQTSSLSPFL
jgi:hypothetical protein